MSQQPDRATRLRAMAIEYHKTQDGEYGCPGATCPGVKRLEALLHECATAIDAVVREQCAQMAENPYSNAVEAFGYDEPFAVGKKIAAAIRAGRQESNG